MHKADCVHKAWPLVQHLSPPMNFWFIEPGSTGSVEPLLCPALLSPLLACRGWLKPNPDAFQIGKAKSAQCSREVDGCCLVSWALPSPGKGSSVAIIGIWQLTRQKEGSTS